MRCLLLGVFSAGIRSNTDRAKKRFSVSIILSDLAYGLLKDTIITLTIPFFCTEFCNVVDGLIIVQQQSKVTVASPTHQCRIGMTY